MPIVKSSYKAPFFFLNGHVSSIYPSLIRRVSGVNYMRERINTHDDDFLDLDWSKSGSSRLVLVLHGLEGDAGRPYVRGMIKWFNQHGWDGVGLNFRGCSGEMNRQLRMYHSGEIEDVSFVLDYIGQQYDYREIVLIGFSLGGSITLNYVGRKGNKVHPLLKKAVAISTPADLINSAKGLDGGGFNTVYLKRFLKKLYKKVEQKAAMYPGQFDLKTVKGYKTFFEFDHNITARIHGFKGALDYYTRASSKPFLKNIKIPTLVLNAKNDSFLSNTSYPFQEAKANPNLFLEVPETGGHVGFISFNKKGIYYSENRALQFVNEVERS